TRGGWQARQRPNGTAYGPEMCRLLTEFRGYFLPGIARRRKIVADIEQLAHVDRIEGLRAGIGEVPGDISKVVVDPVTPGEQVELVEVADSLTFDQARHRPPGDGQRPRLHGLVLRIDPAVANDVSAPNGVDAETVVDLLG